MINNSQRTRENGNHFFENKFLANEWPTNRVNVLVIASTKCSILRLVQVYCRRIGATVGRAQQ